MTNDNNQSPLHPPIAAVKPTQRTFHGRLLEDPYHWLKDPNYPNVSDPAILAYLEAENAYFEAWLQPHKDQVERIFEELKARQPNEDESVPYTYNNYDYQWRFPADAQYRCWYRKPAQSDAHWELLLDENDLAKGHDYFRLSGMAVSPDNRLLAYGTDTDGSERFTLVIKSLETGALLDHAIPNTLSAPVWAANSASFYYVVVNDAWRPYEVRHHHIDSTKPDGVIYTEKDDSFFVSLSETQSEQYILIESGDHVTNETYFLAKDRATEPKQPKLIAPRRKGHEYHVDHRDDLFYIRSNRRTANFDIVTAPIDSPDEAHWQPFTSGDDKIYITDHLCLADYLIVEQRTRAQDEVCVYNLVKDNTHHTIELTEEPHVIELGTNPNFATHTLRLHFESMVTPDTVYDYDLVTHSLKTLKQQVIPSGYTPGDYTSERLMIRSRDGVDIPVSLVRRVDTPIDANTPVHLYAYGAYGYAIPPGFSTNRLSLLDRGFCFAIAHIRGGDELGYDWYTAGKLNQRTNTFNDFVDVARQLVTLGYTSPGRICISGGSAGGELMGAVVNQAPELWGAVAAHVPFVDVLNTMLDDTLPLTPIEWPEWGNPIEDEQAFTFIQSYSPYDQLREGHFPPMLVTAGLNDPRVTYWEPAKYVAKLRTLKLDESPLLLKTNMGAGHGGKSGRFESLYETAEEYVFFLSNLDAG